MHPGSMPKPFDPEHSEENEVPALEGPHHIERTARRIIEKSVDVYSKAIGIKNAIDIHKASGEQTPQSVINCTDSLLRSVNELLAAVSGRDVAP